MISKPIGKKIIGVQQSWGEFNGVLLSSFVLLLFCWCLRREVMGRWQSEACGLPTAWAERRQLQFAHWPSQAPWWKFSKYAGLIVNVVQAFPGSGYRQLVVRPMLLLQFLVCWHFRILLEFCYLAGSADNEWYRQQSFKLLLQHQTLVCATSVFWLNGFGGVAFTGAN